VTVLHLVAKRVLPYPGGLQESIMRISGSLALAGYRVVVYALDQPPGYRFVDSTYPGLMTVLHLDGQERLLEPYCGEGYSGLLGKEKGRVAALLLRNAVDRQVENDPDSQHLIVSFYASGTGFLAQMTATALRLPHLASVRGTDFELDVFGTKPHSRLRVTVEGASQVVTTNREQADSLSAIFKVRQPVRTIHNALPEAASRPLWQASSADTVRLISDCGFSGRKATHILLSAVAALVERNLPVSLTVLGGIFWLEPRDYWTECQRSYQSRYSGKFSFPGQVSHEELDRYLRSSHIYCSASLAEGSSMSRIRALTLGIPMVTTANGGLPEVASGCRHVRLCRAGDGEALTSALEAAVSDMLAGTLRPDRACIERWQRHFCVERERDEWMAAIEAALAGGYQERL
jgi:glycosyltransferase involved in cell wall biosynthesis